MGHPRSSPEGFGFGEHGFFSDGEEEGVAEFEAGVAFGVGREGADPEVLAADDDGAAGVAVAVEEVVAVAVEIEGGIAEGGEVDASFNADAVLVGGEGELNGAVAAGEEVVAGGGPGGGGSVGERRGGEEWMLAANASEARGKDEVLVGAFGVGGVRVEAADEAFGFGLVGHTGLRGSRPW